MLEIKDRIRMKRSREAIITKMLDICSNGASKTRIVYQANLNFKTVVPYLNFLIKKELIECNRNKSIIYKTTLKGAKLLKEFKSIQSEMPELYGMSESENTLHMKDIDITG